MSSRQYDVVVWGATGYTGGLTAQHIAQSFPTDIQWAVAGRSLSKLQAVVESCAKINPDRSQPSIEIVNLDEAELGDLARKTTILIATVGPYAQYGEPAVKACAENGTHYLDVTGELPWVFQMTRKYEQTAKSTGAILISELGIEATPSDLLAWSLVAFIRRSLGVPTREVVLSLHDFKSQASGGTLASALGILDHFTLRELSACSLPFAHSPIPGPTAPLSTPLSTRLLGIRRLPILGLLTTHIGAVSDVPIVERSWGLLGDAKVYGPNFRYSEYLHTSSVAKGLLVHVALAIGKILLLLPFVRWALRRWVAQPGEGAPEEVTRHDFVEYRALGWPDAAVTEKAYAHAEFRGGLYRLTGIFLAQAALTLLKDEVPAKKLGGGFLTPATLGQPYIDRLAEQGFEIETEMLQ